MLLLALSVAPGIAICLYIFLKDRFNREPGLNLLVCFLLGCLSIIPAIIIQLLFAGPTEQVMGGGIIYTAIFAYLIVGCSEEGSKYIMLRFYAFPKKSFDEPFDGIVYSVMVGMGFATVENIGYVLQHGLTTAFLRMFLSVPAHATFAIIMGYYVGKAKFIPQKRSFYTLTGLACAILFHGTFDFFLFLQENDWVNQFVSDGLLFVGALGSFILGIWLSRKAIKEHVNTSANLFSQQQ